MNFENSVRNIDDIIKQLSDGEIPLDEAVELYKKGVDAIACCRSELEKAKLKITSAEDIE